MLVMRETYVNQTKGYNFGNSEWYETSADTKGELFKDLQKEFGRCASKIYVDLKTGGRKEIGWVFEKEMVYEDCRSNWPSKEEKYIREVWVEVREVEEEKE